MSKVSVTGSKAVMDDVVETVHDMNLLHLSDYDESWEGFKKGDPSEGAEEASEKLVTVRSLESILDVDGSDAGPSRIVTDDALEEELESVRVEANRLDDERSEIADELRTVEDRIDALEPFAALGIDMDLLRGYDSLEVTVGQGDADAIREALAGADSVDAFEVYGEGDAVAAFVYPDGDTENVLDDALVGVNFARVEIPADAEGEPGEYIADLRHRKQKLESKLNTKQDELEELKLDAAGFLLAAEETLSIEVQKDEAPLSFATTDNAFVAEGWVPTDEFDAFRAALTDAVGDRVDVEELERAAYEPAGTHGHGHDEEVAADGGTTMDDQPPVVQENPSVASPFEVLTQAVGQPKYWEFDPTVILLLTFPAFFGFMIGDVAYGALYIGIGWYLASNFDSPGLKSMGGIAMWAGAFTILFGVLYGELFGLHMADTPVLSAVYPFEDAIMKKGLMPANIGWAIGWLVVSLLVSLVHLNVGYLLDFKEKLDYHGTFEAVTETGSWMLMLNGAWVWIFSEHAAGTKPDLLYNVFAGGQTAGGEAFPKLLNVGFAGFPVEVGYLGGAIWALGLVLLLAGPERMEVVEFAQPLVNALSYTRLAAVLLAKAGMAFVVNLLFFGAYTDDKGYFHFLITHGPEYGADHGTVMFGGLVNSGEWALVLVGLLILVLGHMLVLILGVTSAGLQAVRLEYVEFFGKFYEGGGTPYNPFGYERSFTTED
jgi:V/A-type H+-transporting ATPase subunit I